MYDRQQYSLYIIIVKIDDEFCKRLTLEITILLQWRTTQLSLWSALTSNGENNHIRWKASWPGCLSACTGLLMSKQSSNLDILLFTRSFISLQQVVFWLTGDCGDHEGEGRTAYDRIASLSSGQVFPVQKLQLEQVINWHRRL